MLAAFLAVSAFSLPAAAADDPPQTRGFDELKAETQSRSDRNAYPLVDLDPAEVKAALATLSGWDRDAWAHAFIVVGDRHMATAAAPGATPRSVIGETLKAWRYYAFARWPVTNAPQKLLAHRKAAEAFSRYAALASPRIEELQIPFEGKAIRANLQLPDGIRPAPLIISIGGVDSWRDGVAIGNRPFIDAGIASLAIDMPGTGEAPLPNAPGSERIVSAILDWLPRHRPDIDMRRILVRGQSWGGYWAARAGYAEPTRLRGVVDQGGPSDHYFTREWQEPSLKSKEYLFDFVQSRLFVWGQQSVATSWDWMASMSFKQGGLIDRPSPPMLLVDGLNDSQTPIGDLIEVATHGTPKQIWINPQGGHMGRGPGWNDERVTRDVVMPWVRDTLAVK